MAKRKNKRKSRRRNTYKVRRKVGNKKNRYNPSKRVASKRKRDSNYLTRKEYYGKSRNFWGMFLLLIAFGLFFTMSIGFNPILQNYMYVKIIVISLVFIKAFVIVLFNK